MRPTIVYFSGTGNIAFVARQFESAFVESGASPSLIALEEKIKGLDQNWDTERNTKRDTERDTERDTDKDKDQGRDRHEDRNPWNLPQDSDFLMIIYPVHSFDAPAPLFEFAGKLSEKRQLRTAVISVCGGGDIAPNRASRVRLIKQLEQKGFPVVYEIMLTMMSNVLYATPPPAAAALLRILPQKCATIVGHLQSGVERRTRAPLFDRFCSLLGLLERSPSGQGSFGKNICAGDACTGCGWCDKSCPRGNITMQEDSSSCRITPAFGDTCVICLRCLYGCPKQALTAEYWSFILIKEGFSFKAVLDYRDSHDQEEEIVLKGFLWKGVREYLGLE